VGFWPCPRSDTSWIYFEQCLNCVCVHQVPNFENKKSIIFTGLALKEEHFPYLLFFLCSVLEDQGELERQTLGYCRYADTALPMW
jgi:hypothetical protein